MADFGISERAKQIAAAAIEGKYGAMDEDIDFDYGYSPERGAYGLGMPRMSSIAHLAKNKRFLIIGGVTLVLVAAAVAGGIYWKKRKDAQQ